MASKCYELDFLPPTPCCELGLATPFWRQEPRAPKVTGKPGPPVARIGAVKHMFAACCSLSLCPQLE